MALGWFHWPPDVAMAADVNSIAAGYKGHMAMLYKIFGKKEPEIPGKLTTVRRGAGGKVLKLTPKAFDGLFGDGHRRRGRGSRG